MNYNAAFIFLQPVELQRGYVQPVFLVKNGHLSKEES